eukprot:184443_1
MSSTLHLKQQLYELIDGYATISDFAVILTTIPIDTLKEFVKEQIKSFDINKIHLSYYNSFPIHQILGMDVIQYILSFNVSNEINCVNKLFNQLSIQNDHIFLQAARSTIDKQQLKYLKLKTNRSRISKSIHKIKTSLSILQSTYKAIINKMDNLSADWYNKLKHTIVDDNKNHTVDKYFCPEKTIKYIPGFNHTIAVVPKKPEPMSEIELLLHNTRSAPFKYEYIGTNVIQNEHEITKMRLTNIQPELEQFDDIAMAFRHCKSGDKIFMYEGTHKLPRHVSVENKDIKIIGIGDNVVLDFGVNGYFQLCGKCNLYVTNVNFVCGDQEMASIKLQKTSSLWFEKCRFDFFSSCIWVSRGCNLYAKKCLFFGREFSKNAICISPWANHVNVINSVFANCGHVESTLSSFKSGDIPGEYSCIEIERQYDAPKDKQKYVQLKCIGNTFIDNFGFTISKKYTKYFDAYGEYKEVWFKEYDKQNYLLQDNVLKGSNGLEKENEVTDANKVYQHEYDKS